MVQKTVGLPEIFKRWYRSWSWGVGDQKSIIDIHIRMAGAPVLHQYGAEGSLAGLSAALMGLSVAHVSRCGGAEARGLGASVVIHSTSTTRGGGYACWSFVTKSFGSGNKSFGR